MNIHKKNRYYAVCLVLLWTLPYIPAIRQRIVAYFWAEPLYWLGIFALIYAVLPRVYAPRKLSMRDEILGCAVFGAFFCLALHFILAVLLKRLRSSPYDLRPTGIALNILQLVPMLLAREYIREYALAAGKGYRKNILWGALLFGILFACSDISFAAIGALRSGEELFVYVMQDIVPALLNSLLLTLFVLYGGAGAACTYALITALFMRVFPFLPELGWFLDSVLGLLFPVLFALYIQERFGTGRAFISSWQKKANLRFYLCLSVVILFAWFNVGVFPLYPRVVLTGSMLPLIREGDMVIIRKARQEADIYGLQVGDIINFDREDINITHRIIEIKKDDAGNLSFVTKGDNNTAKDWREVNPNEINGRIVYRVPYLGLPAFWIQSGREIPEGVRDVEVEQDTKMEGRE